MSTTLTDPRLAGASSVMYSLPEEVGLNYDSRDSESDDDDDEETSSVLSSSSEESIQKEVDGDDLRRAGEYGKALLELLEKESERARLLSELLDREQKLNDQLLSKQEDISRLRRRATYQQSHLELLEDQAQELEENLDVQRREAINEKRRRVLLEKEIGKLRKLISTSENEMELSFSGDESRSVSEETTVRGDKNDQVTSALRERFIQANQCDSPILPKHRVKQSPLKAPPEVKSVAKSAALVGQQMTRILSDQNISDSQSPKQAQQHLQQENASQYDEIRHMYEEERERRQQLQVEVETLLEECELQKQRRKHQPPVVKKPPLSVDLAVRALCEELGYRPHRRATIGKCQLFTVPDERSRIRANLNRLEANQLVGLDTPPLRGADKKFSLLKPAKPITPVKYVRETVKRCRKVGVVALQGPGEKFMTFVIQVENADSGWRMVQTRFSQFAEIFQWIENHHQGGLLSTEPLRYPEPKRGGSLSPQNVKERRVWLQHIILFVQTQQPQLLDPLIDYIGAVWHQYN